MDVEKWITVRHSPARRQAYAVHGVGRLLPVAWRRTAGSSCYSGRPPRLAAANPASKTWPNLSQASPGTLNCRGNSAASYNSAGRRERLKPNECCPRAVATSCQLPNCRPRCDLTRKQATGCSPLREPSVGDRSPDRMADQRHGGRHFGWGPAAVITVSGMIGGSSLPRFIRGRYGCGPPS